MRALGSLFNLSGPDLVIIIGIVLLLFTAKKLPELASRMGEGARDISKGHREFSNLELIAFVLIAVGIAMWISVWR